MFSKQPSLSKEKWYENKNGRERWWRGGGERSSSPHQKLGNPRKFLAVSTVVILGSGRKPTSLAEKQKNVKKNMLRLFAQ